MRAEDQDPGQSSPRSQLEVHIIKSLVAAIYNEQIELKSLLTEDTSTVRKREACKEMVGTLRKSLEFLSEVRDFYF